MSRLAQTRSSPVAKRVAGPGSGPNPPHDGEQLHSRMDRMSLRQQQQQQQEEEQQQNLRRLPDRYRLAADVEANTEICPVCRTSKYMRPDMKLLLNPVCYHKMCESCVDRIFSHGPNKCPIPRCEQTLRKNRFRTQTFEDIQVEREVDIRRKVAAVFNRREDEFEQLRDWNDYLNEVEDITFNLVNGLDVEETEARFQAYERANEADIAENASLAQREQMSYETLQKAEREAAKTRREAARREEAEERREMAAGRKDALRRLESGQDPEKFTQEGAGSGPVMLKKRLNRQAAEQRQQQLQSGDQNSTTPLIKGLKAKTKPEPEAPIDPFGGYLFRPQYYTLQDDYVWDGIQTAKHDIMIGAGGYDIASFTNRALCDAFCGLDVMIADEATERERPQSQSNGNVSHTTAADAAMTDVEMDDSF